MRDLATGSDNPLTRAIAELRMAVDQLIDEQKAACQHIFEHEIAVSEPIGSPTAPTVPAPTSESFAAMMAEHRSFPNFSTLAEGKSFPGALADLKGRVAVPRPVLGERAAAPPPTPPAPAPRNAPANASTVIDSAGASQFGSLRSSTRTSSGDDDAKLRLEKLAKHLNDKLARPRDASAPPPSSAGVPLNPNDSSAPGMNRPRPNSSDPSTPS